MTDNKYMTLQDFKTLIAEKQFQTSPDFSDLIHQSLANYINHGLQPGGFLTAVLANDLMGATIRADALNRKDLWAISSYVLTNLPPTSFGSYDIVTKWVENFERSK